MEFYQRLQELRKQSGLTQEELADKLYVSRTAISKWESNRGYPNIDSLKAIAKFFSVTVDELLSSNEAIRLAEEENKQKNNSFRDLLYGLLDISIVLLLFLPLFGTTINGSIQSVALITANTIKTYLKIAYIIVILISVLTGVSLLALQNCQNKIWLQYKAKLSLALSVFALLLFIISSQPYAAVYTFALLSIKALTFIKR